jgi:hypothetical protein
VRSRRGPRRWRASPDRATAPVGPGGSLLSRRAASSARASVGIRIGGTTLRLRFPRALPAVRLAREHSAFAARGSADIDLEVVEAAVPVPRQAAVFESGGTWRAYELGRGILYEFRRPMGEGPPARGLLVDRKRRRGRLYLAPGPYRRTRGFALSFPLDELLFAHHLAHHGGFVLHACGIDTGTSTVAFCGHSGAGKSTTARLWRRFVPRARVLSDDRLVIRRRRGEYWAYGTPWHGTARYASRLGRPLRALVFLRQARRTSLRRLEPSGLAARLLALTFPPPWEAAGFAGGLRACAAATRLVPAHRFGTGAETTLSAPISTRCRVNAL